MVRVSFKDGKSCYMDNGLYDNILDSKKKIKKDDDITILVDGIERGGKSVFVQQIARTYDPTFCFERMCFTEQEFVYWIDNAKKGQAVVFDEAYRGLSSDKWADKVARLIRSKMMEMGQKNLIVFIVCPNFFMLHKYVALHRSRGLFHVYRKGGQRGFWSYFNNKNKQKLYIKGKQTLSYNGKGFPKANLIGRFYEQYVIDEESYRKKKSESYKEFALEDETDAEEKKYHRNELLYGVYEFLGHNKAAVLRWAKDRDMKMGEIMIDNAVKSIGAKYEKEGKINKEKVLEEEKKKYNASKKERKSKNSGILFKTKKNPVDDFLEEE